MVEWFSLSTSLPYNTNRYSLARLQNVAGFDEISLGQIPQIGVEVGASFINVGAETGKSGPEVEKVKQK